MQIDNIYTEQDYEDYADEQEYDEHPEESEYQDETDLTDEIIADFGNLSLNAVFTPQEYKRFKRGECFECGKTDHKAIDCPIRRQKRPLPGPSRPQQRPPPSRPFKGKGPTHQRKPPFNSNARNLSQTINNIMSGMTDEERTEVLSTLNSDF